MIRIATICARGGSKGVPGKNIRLLNGKPLIQHTVLQALESNLFQAIAISSDSSDILDAAFDAGAQILVQRPDDLASDTSAKSPAIKHCLLKAEKELDLKCTVFVDLDVTSPLRKIDDIKGAVSLLEKNDVSSVITGAQAHRSPYFNLVERNEKGVVGLSKKSAQKIVRRQDAPECFDMNASIYVWNRDAFVANPKVFYDDTMLFEMPRERSLDIDSELDFEIVEYIMQKQAKSE